MPSLYVVSSTVGRIKNSSAPPKEGQSLVLGVLNNHGSYVSWFFFKSLNWMDIVPFILWNHLVKNCQTFKNLAVLPRILWYAWQAIPPSPRGHFRSTCYIELTPTDVRGDQVMGSFEVSIPFLFVENRNISIWIC